MSDDLTDKMQCEEIQWDNEPDNVDLDLDWDEDDDLDYGEDDEENRENFDPPEDQFRDDVEADADTLASAGYGTDEDYGYYGGDEYE